MHNGNGKIRCGYAANFSRDRQTHVLANPGLKKVMVTFSKLSTDLQGRLTLRGLRAENTETCARMSTVTSDRGFIAFHGQRVKLKVAPFRENIARRSPFQSLRRRRVPQGCAEGRANGAAATTSIARRGFAEGELRLFQEFWRADLPDRDAGRGRLCGKVVSSLQVVVCVWRVPGGRAGGVGQRARDFLFAENTL